MSSTPPPRKEVLDELLLEFSNLKAYADALRQQIELTANILTELALSKSSLEEIKARGGEGEVLVHVGAGNYIRVQLHALNNVIMGVGAGFSVEKSVSDAIAEMETRIRQGQEQSLKLQEQYGKVSQRLAQLQEQIDSIYARLEATGQA
ncbi:MAG: prefoldin subunit alpha [Candidatus Verstraetearchaeota archaeon]|nr:prefoldin subunit alpha [Candidatus Verstraetearchaeota archaeon]